MYIHIYIYIHMYVCIHIYIYIHTCLLRIHISTYIHMHVLLVLEQRYSEQAPPAAPRMCFSPRPSSSAPRYAWYY